MTEDLYRLLEVDPAASPEVVAAAYRVIAKRLHPDVAGTDTTREMAAVNAAYDVLHDPLTRSTYDRSRAPGKGSWAGVTVEAPYMRFGAYKGQRISDVPTDYLLWVIHNVDRAGDVFDASQELVRRGMSV